jgi:hypothetical protein
VLLVVYGGDTHSLIPLYMIGVFVSFTLSQAGMVVHWRRSGGPGWRASAAVNGFGALVTGIVLVIVAITKAHEGAWIVLVLIPLHVAFFRMAKRHYALVASQLSLKSWQPGATPRANVVLVPISGVHRAVVQAVEYARSLSRDVHGVFIATEPGSTDRIRADWDRWCGAVPLVTLESPYRSVMEPLMEHIDALERDRPGDFLTIVLPEFVPSRWWHHMFHNQRAFLIKAALLFRPNVVVTSVPFHLRD